MKTLKIKWLTAGTTIAAILLHSTTGQAQSYENGPGNRDLVQAAQTENQNQYSQSSSEWSKQDRQNQTASLEQRRSGRNDRTPYSDNSDWSDRDQDSRNAKTWTQSGTDQNDKDERYLSRSERKDTNRNNPRSYENGQSSQGEEMSRVRGTVEAFRSIRFSSTNEDRTLVRLRLESGRSVIVDLGENSTLRKLDLSQGDRVRIEGDVKMINGRRIVEANRVWIDGDRASASSMSEI